MTQSLFEDELILAAAVLTRVVVDRPENGSVAPRPHSILVRHVIEVYSISIGAAACSVTGLVESVSEGEACIVRTRSERVYH